MANFEGFCPVRDILSQIGDKWSVLAMVAMQKYGVRLTELGESFQPALNGIIDWALANRDALAPHDATKSVR